MLLQKLSLRKAEPAGPEAIFAEGACDALAQAYPGAACSLGHTLPEHPLLALDALAELAESLPESSIEVNHGDLATGLAQIPEPGVHTIGDTIRGIVNSKSWAVLRNIEQNKAYAALIEALKDELRPAIAAKTGRMTGMQGFISISSPGTVAPYHLDPGHSLLMQLFGTKDVTHFPAEPCVVAGDAAARLLQAGEAGTGLDGDELRTVGARTEALAPGEARFLPAMTPHQTMVGPTPSITLSLAWRSQWAFATADERAYNALLGRFGIKPLNRDAGAKLASPKAMGLKLYCRLARAR